MAAPPPPTATAIGTASIYALARDAAGYGGAGADGANGGNGAAATLNDAAKAGAGSTAATVQIDQTASGGGGGASDTGNSGKGGAATADQNVQSLDSTSLYVDDTATGGNGGYDGVAANGGAGGAATVNATASGSGEVQDYALAEGGGSLTSGGAANATINATGGLVYGTATADAGGTATGAAKASASATGDGSSGNLATIANSDPTGSPLIEQLNATTKLTLVGDTATAASRTAFGGGLSAISGSGFAEGIALPTGYSSILSANPGIKAALGPSPTIFDEGELGGAYAGTGAGTQTETSSVQVQVNLADLKSAGSFVLGLYDGAITDAAGVSQVTLSVTQGFFGPTMFAANYTGAQTLTAFTDGVPLLTDAGFTNSGTEDLEVSLTVTTTQAGAGFKGDFIFGDPPKAATAMGKPEMSFLRPPAAPDAGVKGFFGALNMRDLFGPAASSARPVGAAATSQRESAGFFSELSAGAPRFEAWGLALGHSQALLPGWNGGFF